MSDMMLNIAAWVETYRASVREALRNDESGQGMVEYGLLLALLAVLVIAVLVVLGPQIAATFQSISDELPAAPAAPAAG